MDPNVHETMPASDFPLWLDPIPAFLQDRARAALLDGNVVTFLCLAAKQHSLDLVWRNGPALRAYGLYEAALVDAFTLSPTHAYPLKWLQEWFAEADRSALRRVAPLPHGGPFTLYRGVAGRGRARRVRGMSWTTRPELATWFAERAAFRGAENPAVFVLREVHAEHVHAYTNGRNEEEFILTVGDRLRPVRVADAFERWGGAEERARKEARHG